MTLLCVPIPVEEIHAALADAQAAKDAGADLVEFRIDHFFTGSDNEDEQRAVLRLVAESPLPCIVTCRAAAEGGAYDGDDTNRVALYERLGTASGPGEHPPRYIDVELDTYTRSENLKQKVNLAVAHPRQVRDLATSLILSTHDFDGRPADLTRRLLRMRDEDAAAVHKVAFRARSLRDNLELFDILAEAGTPTIALAMGEFGLMSRVLAPKFGGFLTFAALRPEAATAPGQPTLRELLDLYRFRSITRNTAVYGLIGYPVAHSLSPAVHNAAFEAAGTDAVYLPLPIPPEYEHFKATLHALIDHPRLGFAGASVTMPHKEHLCRFAGEQRAAGDERWQVAELASACGAANTLVIERRPGAEPHAFTVANTDGPAVITALTSVLHPRRTGVAAPAPSFRNVPVAILGAGGAARCVAAALAHAGANILIVNRTADRAGSLADSLNENLGDGAGRVAAANAEDLTAARPAVVINCTSVGMASGPSPDGMPLPARVLSALGADTIVFETVYDPAETPLLRAAKAAGMRTIGGMAMFVRQAAMQFEAWTGENPPLNLYERIAGEALGARMKP